MAKMNLIFFLDSLRERYEESKNPLIFWEVLQVCLDEKLPIPDWVSNYFRESATKLIELADRQEKSGQRAAFEVYRALGMKKPGSGNIFTQFQRQRREQKVIWKILDKAEFDDEGEIKNIVKLLKDVTKEMKKEDPMLEYGTVSDIYFKARGKLGLLPKYHELILNERRKKIAKNKIMRKKKALDRQKLQT
jgi:hypothetical protein